MNTLPRLLVLTFLLCGCANLAAEPAPSEIKSDLRVQGRSAVDHGALPMELDVPVALHRAESVHVYQLDLSAPSEITLETRADATAQTVDTLLEIYRLPLTAAARPLARNDDGPDTRFSLLRRRLPAGSYLVQVRGFKRSTEGTFLLRASCTGDGCPISAPTCPFGAVFHDLRENARIAIQSETWITSVAGLSALLQEQMVLAVQQSSHTDVTSAEEALARVDQNEIRHMAILDRRTGQQYVVLEYGAGDNSYGAIIHAGSLELAASIHDGDLLECTADPTGLAASP